MARKTTTVRKPTPAQEPAKPNPADLYQSMLDGLNTGGALGGNFFFPKAGKTRFRLVAEDPYNFYREVTNNYGRTKYLVTGVILDADQDEEPRDATKIVGIVIPKTVLKGVISNLAEGFDLFGYETGHALSLTRMGSGKTDTSYSVGVSPKPIPLDEDELEWPDNMGLDELADVYNDNSSNQNQSKDTDDSPPW